jgi:hypothetical protein
VVTGGGGGPRHKVTSPLKEGSYNDLFPGPQLRFFHFIDLENKDSSIIFNVYQLENDGKFTTTDPLFINNRAVSNSSL